VSITLTVQVRKYAAEQDAISAEAKALVKRSRQKEAANTKLWEEVHKAAQVCARAPLVLQDCLPTSAPHLHATRLAVVPNVCYRQGFVYSEDLDTCLKIQSNL